MHSLSVARRVEWAYDVGGLRTAGKFFFRGQEKVYLRGVTYGPFAPRDGAPFPQRDMVLRDFALMREPGANCLRTFTVPPKWFLDLVAEHGLMTLVGIPWTQHVCFLDDRAIVRDIRSAVTTAVHDLGNHPAVAGILIGNEIPPDVVRWHGPRRVARFLGELYAIAKQAAPDALVSYANFPPTEYLELDFVDFVAFNVYLHREADFRRYLSRLQNLAGDKPLVLTEFGIDSLREGTRQQAEILSRQLRAAFECGVAGTFVFSWTDDWFTGGFQVEDWAFGLVDRNRSRKPAFQAVQQLYRSPLPPALSQPPKISVVICAYNAERTMDACLASLRELRYPNYEVIVVNDGSTDGTEAIARRYPEFRLLSQPNKGLSAARNAGLEAARGEIVAYTDSDCVADPDWLTYLAYKFASSDFAGVGGPNLPPPEDSATAAYVAAAPGGPTHVLLDDEVAEHIPGCNMAFRKSALEHIGGFDPVHRAAGDDVDVCWRLQDAGYRIGFSPAAQVWHFRRNTIRAYLKQQMGYGQAEAQLYFKHPFRFNMLGQSQWIGRIYGDIGLPLLSARPIIYYGVFGRGLFQTLYETPSSLLAYLPFTLEWNLLGVTLLSGALLAGRWRLVAALPLVLTAILALGRAWKAKIDPRFDHWRGRLLVAALIYLGPLVRSMQRYLYRLQGQNGAARIQFTGVPQRPEIEWRRREILLRFWSEHGTEKENFLHALIEFLAPRKYLVAVDQGWSDHDITVHRGLWSRVELTVAAENHGGNKRLLRTRSRVRASWFARSLTAILVTIATLALLGSLREISEMALLLLAITLGVTVVESFRLGQTVWHAQEIVAQQLRLVSNGEQTSG
ncbi:Putative mycofactocin biosynthesis glycosyltransferase MftF [bacterium HR30]|nr:Putative mycofactocin biosynthesis glycosyltransferase MftF [bacterium HR30]